MASNTPTITLQQAQGWVRIDNSMPIVAGKILSGLVQLELCDSAPADTDLGLPFTQGEPFSISLGTGQQLWARSTHGAARVGMFRRAAS